MTQNILAACAFVVVMAVCWIWGYVCGRRVADKSYVDELPSKVADEVKKVLGK
jgi:hypothetical protein